MSIIRTILVVTVIAGLALSMSAFASTTDGTIDSTNKYAWGENVGWINFGSTEGDVHITPLVMTGYAWGENIGWISLNCSNDNTCATVNYGVVNDSGGGNLSGYAWGENVGWINFDPTYSGVTIDGNGTFSGYAWGENVGWISFNCSNTNTCAAVDYKVDSDYQPAPSSGGGNAGGGTTGGGEETQPSTPAPTTVPTSSATPVPTATPTTTPTPTPVTPTPTASATPLPTGTPPPTTPLPSPSVTPPTESPPPIQPTSPPPELPPPSTFPEQIVETVNTIGQGIDAATDFVAETMAQATRVAGRVLVETEPIPIPTPVQDVARTVVQVVPGNEQTVTTVSAVGTTVTAVSSVLSISTVFGGIFDLANYGTYLGLSLLEVFAIRKRREPWGTTYDAYTKRPIPFAKVQLLDEANRVLETRVTDSAGRYGFLVTPEHFGTEKMVTLFPSKPGYTFPTKLVSSVRDTVLYDNVYTGGLRTVRVNEVANYNIPLDPLERPVEKIRRAPSLRLNTWLVTGVNIGFWGSALAAPLQYFAHPSLLNLLFTLLLIGLAVGRALGFRARRFGVVADSIQKLALPFTLITLNDVSGKRSGFAVADEYGRYFLLAPGGTYTLNAHTPATIVPGRTLTEPITTRKGWIARKLIL